MKAQATIQTTIWIPENASSVAVFASLRGHYKAHKNVLKDVVALPPSSEAVEVA